MGSLPRAKAGVGSAVNDTTRQVGGALGVAIIGSVMSSVYQGRITKAISGRGLSHPVAEQANAKSAFVTGLHEAVLVGAGAAFVGAIIAAKFLPARAPAGQGLPAAELEPEPQLVALTEVDR